MAMTKMEIGAALARDRVVEQMVCNIAHTRLSQNLKDLCQMVYLILLEYDEDKIVDLWESGQIRFFLARVIVNQLRSPRSPYHAVIRRFSSRTDDITDKDFADE